MQIRFAYKFHTDRSPFERTLISRYTYRFFPRTACLTMRARLLLKFLACLAASAPSHSQSTSSPGPSGCRKLNTDLDWPSPDVWRAEIPGVLPQNNSDAHGSLPDYRLRAKSVSDVQAAVRFASKYNIRLTAISTGHDQLGRSDAGSGLIVDLSLMKKVHVLDSFTATSEGVTSPNYTVETPNTIAVTEGVQAAVTFQPGVNGLALNYAVAPSGLFTTSGAAGTPSLSTSTYILSC